MVQSPRNLHSREAVRPSFRCLECWLLHLWGYGYSIEQTQLGKDLRAGLSERRLMLPSIPLLWTEKQHERLKRWLALAISPLRKRLWLAQIDFIENRANLRRRPLLCNIFQCQVIPAQPQRGRVSGSRSESSFQGHWSKSGRDPWETALDQSLLPT